MRKSIISLILCCCLLIVPLTAISLVRAQPNQSTLTLTANVNSTYSYGGYTNVYDRYAPVTLTGSMLYNEYTNKIYVSDALAGVEIQDSTGATMLTRTILAQQGASPGNLTAKITAAYICDAGGNQLTIMPLGAYPSIYINVQNLDASNTHQVLAALSIFDSNGVPIAFYSSWLNIDTYPATSFVRTNFNISPDAHYGAAYAYVDVFSALPSDGGVPLGLEYTFTFNITGGTPFQGTPPTTNSLNGLDHYYNFTFRLPKQCQTGEYTIYTTANYYGIAGKANTTFEVLQIGDLNGDGQVNFSDLIIFVADYIAFYKTPPTYTATCDFNNDGQINFGDLTLFVHYYIYYWSS